MASLDELWNSMAPRSRMRVAALAGVIVLLAVGAMVWVLSSGKYEPLFTAMEPEDAAAVMAELERMGVPYQLSEGGTRIAVPAPQVPEVRVKLMGSGVPLRGGVGFEVFDNSDFGMTEFAQKINYQRALEGELTRTITSLKEVKYARVHLVMPETSLFRKQQSPPSASVTLFLKQEAGLDASRILGIQRLVAASVPGLDAQGVTVTNQDGVTLSRSVEQDGEAQAISARLKRKQEIEAHLTGKVMDVLARALGPDRAVVSVDVSLNMNQVRTTREEVIPHGNEQDGIIRRRESKSESGNAATPQGSVVTEVEYSMGRQVEQISLAPGTIERLSVGVLVPEDVNGSRLEEIRALVAMAVGLNRERGDELAVFATALPVAAAEDPVPAAPAVQPPSVPQSQAAVVQPQMKSGSAAQGLEAWDPKRWLQPQVIGLALAIVAVVIVLLAALRGRQRRLRPDERVLMLKQLEQWLQSAPAAAMEKGQQ